MISLSVIPNIFYNDVLNLTREFFYEHYISDVDRYPKIQMKFEIQFTTLQVIMSYADESCSRIFMDSFCEDNLFCENEKKHQKNSIKRCIVRLLQKVRRIDLPWGILTGVRPVKIVHLLRDKGHSENFIHDYLSGLYISEENTERMISISNVQRKFIYPLNHKRISIYIHIPFCPSKCVYCSFHTMVLSSDRSIVKEYLAALEKEIFYFSKLVSNCKVDTVYIGGGTPTVLQAKELDELFLVLKTYLDLSELREWTVEAGRPDSINEEQLSVFQSHGVTRISINPQTMNDQTLKRINRHHTVEDVFRIFEMVRNIGFQCINADLIIGLEEETTDDFLNTLRQISTLDPDNLTIHTLSLKKGARYRESYVLHQMSDVQNMLSESKQFCQRQGFFPYYLYRQKNILGNLENIGYAKVGYECIYNILMMEEKQTVLGFGMGAVSKFLELKSGVVNSVANYKNMKDYLTRLDEQILKKRRVHDQIL